MLLTVGPEHTIRSCHDIHDLYSWLFWDLQLDCDWDVLHHELHDVVTWQSVELDFQNKGRQIGDISMAPTLQTLTAHVESFKNKFIDMAYESYSPVFRKAWCHPSERYRNRSTMQTKILKDSPGYSMSRHLDNSHIMLQAIVNLQQNHCGTELLLFNDTTPVHRMSGDQGRGLLFVNSPGSVHTINSVEQDRYILYTSVIYN